MSFKEQIIEAGMGLSKDGDCVDVAPEKVVPKLFRVCKAAEEALKAEGVSVVWDSSKACAVLCKGKPAPAPEIVPEPEPTPEPEESGQAMFDRFAGWDEDDKKEN